MSSKFIFCTDLHLRTSVPRCRKESTIEWINFQIEKLEEIFKYAKENNINYILCGGDFFDYWKVNDEANYFLIKLINLFKKYYWISFEYIYGNHDLPYHNKEIYDKSLIGLLSASCMNFFHLEGDYAFDYGEVCTGSGDIAIVHENIFENEIPPYMEGTTAKEFLKTHDYKLVLAGHLHQNYVATYKGKKLINGGCLTRQNIGQKDFRPCFWVIEYDLGKIEQVFISYKEDELHDERKIKNEIGTYIEIAESLKENDTFDFKRDVELAMEREKVTDNVRRLIEECIYED